MVDRVPPGVHPSADDPFVAALSEPLGGPVGTRVRARGSGPRGSWWTPLRVLLALTALTFALGLVTASACAATQWRGATQYSHVCTSEIADAYTGTGLVEGAWPWTDDASVRSGHPVLQEPALVGLWSYAAARATHVLAGSPDLAARRTTSTSTLAAGPEVRRERTVFVAVNAVGLAVLALLTTAALSRVHRRRPWDAAGFAVAPLLVLTGLTAWDLLAVCAAALALLAWSRGRIVAAGVCVGLGAAAGVWPVLLVGAFALSTRHPARRAQLLPLAAWAAGTWVLVDAPALLTGRASWERFWEVALDRGPDSGTIWTILDGVFALPHATVLATSWALVGLWVVAVVVICVKAPAPPRAGQAALLLVAGFVLLRPSFEPHQALWLLPLAVLARPRWRDLVVWQACAIVFAALHVWSVGGLLVPGGGGVADVSWVGIGVHVAGTLWLVAVVVGDVWWPGTDPVAEEREGSWPPQVTTTWSNDVVV